MEFHWDPDSRAKNVRHGDTMRKLEEVGFKPWKVNRHEGSDCCLDVSYVWLKDGVSSDSRNDNYGGNGIISDSIGASGGSFPTSGDMRDMNLNGRGQPDSEGDDNFVMVKDQVGGNRVLKSLRKRAYA